MRTRTKILIAVGAVAVAAIVVPTIALASADDDGSEVPITGAALEQASRVAIDHVGGGRVTGTEVGDEESHYEVEVTLEDGTQIDVQLDEDFNVVQSETDVEDDGDGSTDD
jgi:uncharacterized membrane protein YkoI